MRGRLFLVEESWATTEESSFPSPPPPLIDDPAQTGTSIGSLHPSHQTTGSIHHPASKCPVIYLPVSIQIRIRFVQTRTRRIDTISSSSIDGTDHNRLLSLHL